MPSLADPSGPGKLDLDGGEHDDGLEETAGDASSDSKQVVATIHSITKPTMVSKDFNDLGS